MFLYTVYVARLEKTRGGWGVVGKCGDDLSVFKGMGERMEPSMDLGGGGERYPYAKLDIWCGLWHNTLMPDTHRMA